MKKSAHLIVSHKWMSWFGIYEFFLEGAFSSGGEDNTKGNKHARKMQLKNKIRSTSKLLLSLSFHHIQFDVHHQPIQATLKPVTRKVQYSQSSQTPPSRRIRVWRTSSEILGLLTWLVMSSHVIINERKRRLGQGKFAVSQVQRLLCCSPVLEDT